MFQEINLKLIEAEKVIKEQRRLQKLLISIEQELVLEQMALSQAVTDLKHKTYNLNKVSSLSVESIYYRLRGRKKEWAEYVRDAHGKSQDEYVIRKKNVTALKNRRVEIQEQLEFLTENLPDCEDLRGQQIEYLIDQGHKCAPQLMDVSVKIAEFTKEKQAIAAIIATGEQAKEAFHNFAQGLVKRSGKNHRIIGASTTIWLLPVELFVESILDLPDEMALNAEVLALQGQLDIFQEQLVSFSRQFWPTILVKSTSYTPEKIKLWFYHLQQHDKRLQAKIEQLQTLEEQMQNEIDVLRNRREELLQPAWQALLEAHS